MCACCVLRFMCGKDIYSRLYFQTGELAICVIPSDNVSYRLPIDCLYFRKLKTPVNLNIILAFLEFVVHYIESQVYITSPHFSFQLKTFIPHNQNGAIWLTFKAVGLTCQLYLLSYLMRGTRNHLSQECELIIPETFSTYTYFKHFLMFCVNVLHLCDCLDIKFTQCQR